MKSIIQFIAKFKFELIILIVSICFSTWLMFSSFSYDNGQMLISTKSWSDFASHIPLIRSFSFGYNFPPQYPLFSGPPIKYHFIFYAFVGLLEKSGLRIDYALNIPSIIGFTFLIFMIYLFSIRLFKSKAVGIISIILFLFNSSLDFLNFFKIHPLSINSINNIISNTNFPSFGPYDGKIISAFWNLNIYTNQRHLALSYALSLLLIFFVLNLKKFNKLLILMVSILLGFSFLLNMAVFLMTEIILIFIFILFKEKRAMAFSIIFISLTLAFPQYKFIESVPSSFHTQFYLGYLVSNLNFYNFINYWVQNLGISLLLIPIAFIFTNNFNRKILVTFFSLFIIGNLIQFSPEIAANHKFFNYFIIIGNIYSAFVVVSWYKKGFQFKLLSFCLMLLLILSGLIDFFPIVNDHKISLADYPINNNVEWVKDNTKPDSVFLNTDYLFDTASLAGRKIFLGWPYFAWSQGLDTLSCDNLRKTLLDTNDFIYFCDNITKYRINYTEINNLSEDAIVNKDFFAKNFTKVFEDPTHNYFVYKLNKCK